MCPRAVDRRGEGGQPGRPGGGWTSSRRARAPAVPVPAAIDRLIARPACAAGLPLPSRSWTLTGAPAGFAAWLEMTLPAAAAAGCAAKARLQPATCAVSVLAGSWTSVVAWLSLNASVEWPTTVQLAAPATPHGIRACSVTVAVCPTCSRSTLSTVTAPAAIVTGRAYAPRVAVAPVRMNPAGGVIRTDPAPCCATSRRRRAA